MNASLDQNGFALIPKAVSHDAHRLGKIPEPVIEALHSTHEGEIVTANSGDLFLMRPLLLHSSRMATEPASRRIIHVEYAAADLADGLEWFFA